MTLADLKYKGIKYLVVLFSTIQLLIITNSPSFNILKRQAGISQSFVVLKTADLIDKMRGYTTVLFGMTKHGVFVDNHFKGYNHIVAIVYEDVNGEVWLPMIDERGMVGSYSYGSNWAYFVFRVNSPNINQQKLCDGIQNITAFWGQKNHINLQNAQFKIKVKKIATPTAWEKDYLRKQFDTPWYDGGYVQWKNKKMISHVKIIENI